jgi:hypothetical protein
VSTPTTPTTKLCHKCNQQKDQVRTYHLVLKNNINPNSILARLDKVNICYQCDGNRKTNIVQFLQNG